ncbi:superoxide dismutase [Cu-Zn]-like [Oppia nitens]|uniref:superoxide dismutase [Cu-Zn]-like n=1 Tax=Oppia nitens TaxID=1686743 RepID=UPI0023DA1B98|nr:superoxide dismutase [Cu-Zn]-like [Oppia nitens]
MYQIKNSLQTDINIDGIFDDKHVIDNEFPPELDYTVETSLGPIDRSTKKTPISDKLQLTGPLTETFTGTLSEPLVKAVVVLRGNGITQGIIHLLQLGSGPTHISGTIIGLTPLYSHGFHFHEKSATAGCESAGEHYNPTHQLHGGSNDPNAHIGDLGNIRADLKGISKVHIIDHKISLIGKYSVIGRSLVVHRNTDDLGSGLNRESKKSGNSGGRLACGTVRFVHYTKG